VLLATVWLVGLAGKKGKRALAGRKAPVQAAGKGARRNDIWRYHPAGSGVREALERDKRHWSRVWVDPDEARAEIRDLDNPERTARAKVRNISQGGVCLELEGAERSFEAGQRLEIYIQVGNGLTLSLSDMAGSIRWIQDGRLGLSFHRALRYSSEVMQDLFSSGTNRAAGVGT
jgi:hypothetical protein